MNHATDDNDTMLLTMLDIWRMGSSDRQASTLKIGNRRTPTVVGFPSTLHVSRQVDVAHIVQDGMLLPLSLPGVCISQNVSNFILLVVKQWWS